MIYLDYNATTPTDPRVVDAMLPYLRELHGNPVSQHEWGRRNKAAVESARAEVAALINADAEEIVFNSGGSEANNHVVRGLGLARGSRAGSIVISAVEHAAVREPCVFLERFGIETIRVGVDRHCRVDPAAVRAAIRSDTFLVSIMLANNEVGTLQPVAEIAAIAREAGAMMHSDAAQAIGKIPVDVRALGIDFLTIAGHKFYAPGGIGAIYIRRGVALESLVHGVGHESGRRAGTAAVANIVGLGVAARLARESLGDSHVREMRDRLHEGLARELGEDAVLNGHRELRLPNTLNIGFRGVLSTELLTALPGIGASQGSACHFDRHEPSAVLKAMGVPRDIGLGAVRFSVGRFTTSAEIDEAVRQVAAAFRSLSKRGV